MLAFCSVRFAVIKDWDSLVSMIMGVFGFGQICCFLGFDFEKMFSICFIFITNSTEFL